MPIVPNFAERLFLLRLNQSPAPLLDFLGAEAFRTMAGAVRLGVFHALHGRPQTAIELAQEIGTNERGTTLLLEALHALGYLTESRGVYSETAMTKKWLPLIADGVPFFERLVFEGWSGLEKAVRLGATQSPEDWQIMDQGVLQKGMAAIARSTASEVARRVRLPDHAHRLIDVGGGHGLYAASFCARNPKLRAEVLDLPVALAAVDQTLQGEPGGDRVAFRAGDFWTDDIGDQIDVAVLVNIVHSYQPDENVELMRRVAKSLNSGGTVVVVDQMEGRLVFPTARIAARLQALYQFVASGGRVYDLAELEQCFQAAGLSLTRRIPLRRTPGVSALIGTK